MGYIYKITNQVNGKVYVGQTVHTIESRWKEHQQAAKYRKYPLYLAINKYGLDKFTVDQIEECDNSELNAREMYWVAYYDSYNHGYNATTGGDGSFTCKFLTDSRYQDVKNMYLGGCTIKTIAEAFKCDPNTISKLLKAMHVTLRNNRWNINNYEKQKVIDMYNNGSSINFIAKQYGSSYAKTKEFLIKNGIDVKKQHFKDVDEQSIINDFFDKMPFKTMENKYHIDQRRIKEILVRHNIDWKKCRFRGKLSESDVLSIIKLYCSNEVECRDIAKKYAVNITTVYDILAYYNIDYRRYNITKSVQFGKSDQNVLQQPQDIEE